MAHAIAGASGLYDAEGRRVAKGTVSSLSCNFAANGFSPTSQYLLDTQGQPMTELDGSGNWVHTNAYANGQLLATYQGSTLNFALNDWLGTRRVQVPVGAAESAFLSLPFGDSFTTLAARRHRTILHRQRA